MKSTTGLTDRSRSAGSGPAATAQSILESIADGFVSIDRDWKYTYVNPAGARFLRRRPHQLVGVPIFEAWPEARGTIFETELRRAVEGRVATRFEIYYLPLRAWFECRCYPSPEGVSIFFSDTTPQKAAEEERERLLQERDRAAGQLEAVVNAMSDGLSISDLEGNVLAMNRAALELHGFTDVAEVRRHLREFPEIFEVRDLEGRPLPVERWPLARALAGETESGVVLRLFRKDAGREKVCSYGFTPVRGEDGAPILAIVTVRDVSERVRADEALRQSEARLELAQKAGGVGVFDWDLLSGKVVWTEQLEKIFGLPPGGFEGNYDGWARRVHPEDLPWLEASIRSWMGERLSRAEFEYRIPGPGGRVRWVAAATHFDYLPDGTPARMIGTNLDITDRKLLEEALAQSEARYRELAESITDPFFAMDSELRYIYWNAASEAITGVAAADALGRRYEELFPGQEDTPAYRVYRAVLDSRRPRSVENRWQRDGREMVFELNVYPTLDGICVLAKDITSRKQAEEALLRAHGELGLRVHERTAELQQRAAQLARLTSELTLTEQRERKRLAQTLHDHLQQLLVAAKHRLELLGREVADVHAPAVAELQGLLEESIRASRTLTTELSVPILHDAGLAAGLEWLARWVRDKHGLRVELEIDPEAVVRREDLTFLLFHAVRELLFNAFKHAGVKSARVELARQDPGHVRVTVSDRGRGFDPQLMWAVAARTNGGLGLFSIRERLALLGGRLEVDSAPRQGARFTLIAPCGGEAGEEAAKTSKAGKIGKAGKAGGGRGPGRAGRAGAPQPAAGGQEPEAAAAEPTARAGGKARIRVLLVDDHPVMRQGISSLLRVAGDIEVVGEASDGEEAVLKARDLRPDIVLMDYSMPRLDGVEATRRIHRELPEVRIIGLSMYEEADRAEAMLDAGAVDYVTKSGRVEDILAVIRRHAA